MTQQLKTFAYYLGVGAILIFFLAPPIWLISTSFKTSRDAFALPPKIIFTPTLNNYREVLSNANFTGAFINSTVIAGAATLGAILLGSLAAYALSFFKLRNKGNLATFIVSLRVAPALMFVLPMFFLVTRLGLRDSYPVIILIYLVVNLPFAILMLNTFFEDVPVEIREAALIDGCSEWTCFSRIIAPIAKGGIAATAILTLLLTWNEFLIALVLTGQHTQTLPVAITSFLTFQGTEWGPLTAAGTMIMVPMLILGLFVQRYLVRGLTMGSVK